MAAEHTFGEVYATSVIDVERPTEVLRRSPALYGAAAWPFSAPAFGAALDLVQDAVLIIDRAGCVRYANAACKALLERARPEGRHVLEIVGLDGTIMKGVLRGMRERAVWRGGASVVIGGECRELELSVGAVQAEGWSQAQGFSIIAHPVHSERPSAARAVFSTLARVASAVAHDINNQIAVVLNYSFILLRDLPSDRPERAHHVHMEELQQAAWRAADTARNLLRLAGKRGPEPASLDVNDVVRDAHATLAMIASSRTDQQLSSEPCITRARQSELEWLLLTLAQRLRTRLGELKQLRIATQGVPGLQRVRIHLDGYPSGAVARGSRTLPSDDDAGDERRHKVSAQLGYELALQVLPDNGLRYAIDLPGV